MRANRPRKQTALHRFPRNDVGTDGSSLGCCEHVLAYSCSRILHSACSCKSWLAGSCCRVKFSTGVKAGIAFPGPIWKEGDHWCEGLCTKGCYSPCSNCRLASMVMALIAWRIRRLQELHRAGLALLVRGQQVRHLDPQGGTAAPQAKAGFLALKQRLSSLRDSRHIKERRAFFCLKQCLSSLAHQAKAGVLALKQCLSSLRDSRISRKGGPLLL